MQDTVSSIEKQKQISSLSGDSISVSIDEVYVNSSQPEEIYFTVNYLDIPVIMKSEDINCRTSLIRDFNKSTYLSFNFGEKTNVVFTTSTGETFTCEYDIGLESIPYGYQPLSQRDDYHEIIIWSSILQKYISDFLRASPQRRPFYQTIIKSVDDAEGDSIKITVDLYGKDIVYKCSIKDRQFQELIQDLGYGLVENMEGSEVALYYEDLIDSRGCHTAIKSKKSDMHYSNLREAYEIIQPEYLDYISHPSGWNLTSTQQISTQNEEYKTRLSAHRQKETVENSAGILIMSLLFTGWTIAYLSPVASILLMFSVFAFSVGVGRVTAETAIQDYNLNYPENFMNK